MASIATSAVAPRDPSVAAPPTGAGDPHFIATRLRVIAAVLVVAVWAVVLTQVQRESAQDLRQSDVAESNLARAFAEHIDKTLQGADQAVRFVRTEYLLRGESLDLASYVANGAVIASDFHLISIIGPDGFVAHSTRPFARVDLREREHFRVHLGGTADRLFVSKPVLGKVSGKWSIQLTRRIELRDGRFGGVVVVSLAPEGLTTFFADIDVGRHGEILLLGLDGLVRARAPSHGSPAGQDLGGSPLVAAIRAGAAGILVAPGSGGERPLRYAYRRLPGHDLAVAIGLDPDEVLAASAQRRRLYLALAAALTAVVIGYSTRLTRRAREQAALIAALAAARSRADAANALKTRFLASVSHELRTPLNGILGYGELVRDGAGDAETRDFGRVIVDSARHLCVLVDRVLDSAKIEAGLLGVECAATPLAPLLQAAQARFAPRAAARGLALELQVDPGCPAQLHTDAGRLAQVLDDLLDNALRFTERGRVAIAARPHADGVEIAVSDTGVGIPAERLARLFDRFEALSAGGAQPGQGAGLGLPLTRDLVALLGGRLAIDSRPGAGTTVTVQLPANPRNPP